VCPTQPHGPGGLAGTELYTVLGIKRDLTLFTVFRSETVKNYYDVAIVIAVTTIMFREP
jgi:hypothetical protein